MTKVDKTARVDGPFISLKSSYVPTDLVATDNPRRETLHETTGDEDADDGGDQGAVKEQKSAKKSVPPTFGSGKC